MQLIMSGVLNVTQVRFSNATLMITFAKPRKLVGVSTSLWTMDRFGRRPLLLWGSFFMTTSHLIIAVLVGLYSNSWPSHRPAGWTSVAFVSSELAVSRRRITDENAASILYAEFWSFMGCVYKTSQCIVNVQMDLKADVQAGPVVSLHQCIILPLVQNGNTCAPVNRNPCAIAAIRHIRFPCLLTQISRGQCRARCFLRVCERKVLPCRHAQTG